MRKLHLTIILFFTGIFFLHADEGMWMPSELDAVTLENMRKAGLMLPESELYHEDQPSIHDAVLGMGPTDNPVSFFGSAAFIGEGGLILTNHHLALRFIQQHSSADNNYIRDGFLAESKEDELQAEGLSVSRMVRIEDVTDVITAGFDTIPARQHNNVMNERGRELAEEHGEDGKYFVNIRSFFSGNQYFMEVYRVYNDVRLVAVPPMEIGKFGGNRDNWQWPRQSADFALLRVYHEELDMPVYPQKHLSVSAEGVDEGDFAMLFGFPGTTMQFLTSAAVRQMADVTHYHSINIRGEKVEIMEEAMAADEDIWVKYTDLHASASNHLLRWRGEREGIHNLGLVERKKEFERSFPEGLNEEDAASYRETLEAIKGIVAELDTLEMIQAHIMEAGIGGAEFTGFVALFDRLGAMATRYAEAGRVEEGDLQREAFRIRGLTAEFFENHDLELEKQILAAMVRHYDNNIPDSYKTRAVRERLAEYDDHEKYISDIFEESIFQSEESIYEFLDNFSVEDGERLEQDPVFQLNLGFYFVNRDLVFPERQQLRNQYGDYHKEYVRLISENSNNPVFPDANSSLRLSFGTARGYEINGEEYTHRTYLSEILDKHHSGIADYDLPEDFVSLLEQTENAETIPSCFINDSHTTGGSSGSPVLDAHGNLVGIGFDRSSHGVVSDFEYFPDYSRNIAVDINYVLFVLEEYMEADHLLEEISFTGN